LRLRLKPEFAKRIASEMSELEKRQLGTTPSYFEDVRSVSVQDCAQLRPQYDF